MLPNIASKALAWVLPERNQLRSLNVELVSDDDSRAVVEAIAELKGLRALTLYSVGEKGAAALEEVIKSGRWLSTSLESFAFSSAHDAFAGGDLTFTEYFSTTLILLNPVITNLALELSSFNEFVGRAPPFPIFAIFR